MTDFVESHGNLLDADVDALVNTVNTVGVMGKGIALQFKKAFGANFKAYQRACRRGEVQIGRMHVFDNGQLVSPRWIINFPTKRHWRSLSRISDIAAGLEALRAEIIRLGIASVAVPPLGCGNGGLAWTDVRPLIEKHLDGLGVEVHVYAPEGAPGATPTTSSTRCAGGANANGGCSRTSTSQRLTIAFVRAAGWQPDDGPEHDLANIGPIAATGPGPSSVQRNPCAAHTGRAAKLMCCAGVG